MWRPSGSVLAQWFCEDCGEAVLRLQAYTDMPMLVGHVHEVIPRSHGGSAVDPENCILLCFADHFNGPSGAHRNAKTATTGRRHTNRNTTEIS